MNDSMYLLPQNGATNGMTNGSAANNRSLMSTPNNTRTLITTPERQFYPEPESGPYAPIEKRRLQTADGMGSAGYTVRIADPDEESGWRECGVVSGDYLLIPNARVRDLAGEIAHRSGLPFQEDRTFFDGKRYFLGLTAKEAQTVEVKPGDVLGLSLGFWNSYDGSRAFSAGVYLTRLVCSNGMVAKSLFKEVRFRHGPGASEWESEVERTLGALRHAEGGIARFAMAARSLASHADVVVSFARDPARRAPEHAGDVVGEGRGPLPLGRGAERLGLAQCGYGGDVARGSSDRFRLPPQRVRRVVAHRARAITPGELARLREARSSHIGSRFFALQGRLNAHPANRPQEEA